MTPVDELKEWIRLNVEWYELIADHIDVFKQVGWDEAPREGWSLKTLQDEVEWRKEEIRKAKGNVV